MEFDIEAHRPGLMQRLGFEQIAAVPHHDLDDGMRRTMLAGRGAAGARGGE